ncbi:MAG: hypothetical protein PF569_02070 [Candidatus Woesearchaeota archaeon]|nr:hypothetical protein [Candidatus Woesearchaeota archaeon]
MLYTPHSVFNSSANFLGLNTVQNNHSIQFSRKSTASFLLNATHFSFHISIKSNIAFFLSQCINSYETAFDINDFHHLNFNGARSNNKFDI